MAQPARRPALNEFFQWETQSWVEVVQDLATDEKAYFMPLEILTSYFTANDSSALKSIISEVFETEFPPIDPDIILRSHTAVFCILLRLGQGQCIEDFVQFEELSDIRLPFDSNHPPAEFSFANDDPDFLQRFCKKQWMYCVPVFNRHMLHKHFGPQRLLPITYKESLVKEGVLDRFVIKLYGPHNRLNDSGKEKAMNNPHINTFVLERYPIKAGESRYKEKVNGFRSVKQESSIRGFYGSYIQGDYYHILLQFPDKGSLEDYFQNEAPPSRGTDLTKFWEALFQLIKGLKSIHTARGAHQHVKPENVLVISHHASGSWDCEFKFADFGVNRIPAGHGQGEARGRNLQEAQAYAPPEDYMPFKEDETMLPEKPSWETDIWSLGCIYSEAAMWIADGYKGLVEYRQQRISETKRISFQGGDCFHNGKQVLVTVLEAHRDIEDRLRRSDHITKDVLDSMVDEMLWEEDRPSAKALWRKAEVILHRARKRRPLKSSEGSPRIPSGQNRILPPLRLQPPTQPLPPIPSLPRGLIPGLPSIVERNHPANVENWRSNVSEPHSTPRSNGPRGPPGEISSQVLQNNQMSSASSVSDFDREVTDSVASWQLGDNNSSTSPTSPFSSPHVSIHESQRNTLNEGRPRVLTKQNSHESRRPNGISRGLSYASQHEVIEKPSRTLSLAEHPACTQLSSNIASSNVPPSPADGGFDRHSMVSDARSPEETRPRAPPSNHSTAGSRHSIAFSTAHSSRSDPPTRQSVGEDEQLPGKAQKLMSGFSLFPKKSRPIEAAKRMENGPGYNTHDARPSMSSHSNITAMPSISSDPASENAGFLSLNTCIEWRKAHKKVKKHSKVPRLPGNHMLESLKERDHVFIIDDSASMAPLWPDVHRVFETLSYIVKGMSPGGTELYFTISYDTWRRKDTSDLVAWAEKKIGAGETDISYRLNLELQSYAAKVRNAKGGKMRPISFYVLTNGVWGQGDDPRKCIGEMAQLLRDMDMQGHVAIQFIAFAETKEALEKMVDLAGEEFAVDIVDCTLWTGNVLKMLRGAIDKPLFASAAETVNELA